MENGKFSLRATYRILSETTLSFRKSIEAFHLFAYTTLKLRYLLGRAGNTGDPGFESGIRDLARCHTILELQLLDCRKEIHAFRLMTNGAFDPDLINEEPHLT